MSDKAYLMLKLESELLNLRNLQSAIDFEIATANRELSLGEWLCDHPKTIWEIQKEFNASQLVAKAIMSEIEEESR